VIVNLTPHALRIFDGRGNVLTVIPPSGVVARASEEVLLDSEGYEVNGIMVPTGTKVLTGKLTGYDPKEGVDYYVSLAFAMGVAAMGMPIGPLLVSLRDHRNSEGTVDGTCAIGRLIVA
jgi:hypothetical protein